MRGGKNKNIVLVMLIGILLHILFSAEGVFAPYNWSRPFFAIGIMISYAFPGILVSIVIFTPLVHIFHKKPGSKMFNIKNIIISIYLGFIIRLFSYVLDFRMLSQ